MQGKRIQGAWISLVKKAVVLLKDLVTAAITWNYDRMERLVTWVLIALLLKHHASSSVQLALRYITTLHLRLPTCTLLGGNVLCKIQEIIGQERLERQTKLKTFFAYHGPPSALPQYHQRLINDQGTLGSISCHLHLHFFSLNTIIIWSKTLFEDSPESRKRFCIQTCSGALSCLSLRRAP